MSKKRTQHTPMGNAAKPAQIVHGTKGAPKRGPEDPEAPDVDDDDNRITQRTPVQRDGGVDAPR